ncbi:MAG: phosphate ABC transporter substrate-binding protein PstS, partial [Mesorhizobium sp.]
AQAEPIRGAGSTLAAPIIGKWATAYESARADGGDYISPDWKVDYEIVGSLAGVLRLDQPDMDFAATDAPINAADLRKAGRQQFPIVMGAIAVVVNLDGIGPGSLRLTGPLLADI